MKKLILIISIFCFVLTLPAQEPKIKFYMNDCSTKEYNVNEITNIQFPEQSDSLQMEIITKGNNSFYYPTNVNDSILFSNESANQLNMELMIGGSFRQYFVSNIDSIIFYYRKYTSITIGSQVWMAKNLYVDHYRDTDEYHCGNPIRFCKTASEWQDASAHGEGAWCYYDNDSKNGEIYGKLYNWYAVNDLRQLAPVGWHVATDEEWKVLEMYLGMSRSEADAGGVRGTDQASQLASRKDLWDGEDSLETNFKFGTSGFSAIPGKQRDYDGQFNYENSGLWWTATERLDDDRFAFYRRIFGGKASIDRNDYYKGSGFSVRCMRD